MADYPNLKDEDIPAFVRLWSFISPEPNSGCWLWTGAISDTGYGNFYLNRKTVNAHKLLYQALREPVPAGLELDHKCRIRSCVNPDHLEPVTRSVNQKRGINCTHTACPIGHLYSELKNCGVRSNGRTYCAECARIRARNNWRKKHG